MFGNGLRWEYYEQKNDNYPVASLYTENGTKILDVLKGNNLYYTIYSGAIPYLERTIQVSYDKAIEATVNYHNLPKSFQRQRRLETACNIIEDKIKNYIINSFLSNLGI